MLIKDIQYGIIHKYGEDCHDSLAISSDGRTLSYYNLQNGDGSRFGDYRFVMEDGEVPLQSKTPDAIHAECYFNVGGFPSVERIRAEVLEEVEKAMYNEAFKVSHEEDGLQKWDGGNWIRYKLFEKVMGKLRQTNGSSIEEKNK